MNLRKHVIDFPASGDVADAKTYLLFLGAIFVIMASMFVIGRVSVHSWVPLQNNPNFLVDESNGHVCRIDPSILADEYAGAPLCSEVR